MNQPLYTSFWHRDHLIALRHILYIRRYNPKKGDIDYTSPSCCHCHKKTSFNQFYSISYGFRPQADELGKYKNLIHLGYICSKHLDRENFQAWLINLAKKKMAEHIARFMQIENFKRSDSE